MGNIDLESSVSGFMQDSFQGLSQTFTDVEVMTTSAVNVVARAKRYGRWWLLKGLRSEVANEALYQQQLRKELEILMQLQHPSVVTAYGLELVQGLGLCIVMDYVEGITLAKWLQGDTSRRERRRVAEELMMAVAYIHNKGIVHRDLKPSNILITRNGGNVKLIDFGLADTDSYVILKHPAGTRRYMSPEQLQTSVADVRNDIYSLGVVLEQMRLGYAYRSIISRCHQPLERRYQNAEELLRALHRHERRGRQLTLLLIIALSLALLALAFIQLRRSHDQQQALAEMAAAHQQERDRQRQQLAVMTDSIQMMRADNQQLKQQQQAQAERQARVTDAVQEGYAIIDDAFRKSGIQQHLDTLSDPRYLSLDYPEKLQMGAKAAEAYCQRLQPTFSDLEMSEIRTALNHHIAARYEKYHHQLSSVGSKE